eukprot:10712298-Prorocentrum_lima.AAC.1
MVNLAPGTAAAAMGIGPDSPQHKQTRRRRRGAQLACYRWLGLILAPSVIVELSSKPSASS